MHLAMEILAIACQVFAYLVYLLGIGCCLRLYRYEHNWGWLLFGAVYLEPFYWLIRRLISGRRLFPYTSLSVGEDGVQIVDYEFLVPSFVIISVAGLMLLVRASRSNRNPKQE
jgi:hypothetical protein